MSNSIKKILIIKFSSLGDVMQTMPLVRTIKMNYSEAKIDYLTSVRSKVLIENNPDLSDIYTVKHLDQSRGQINKCFSFIELLSVINSLRKRNYELVILLHRHKLFKWFASKLKAKVVLGWEESKYLTKSIPFDLKTSRYRGMFDLFELYKPLRRKDHSLVYIQDFQKPDISVPYIVMAPGGGDNVWSSMSNKRWNIQNYDVLIKELAKEYAIVLVGGKNDELICNQIKNNKIINLCGKLSIKELANYLKYCELFIGHDSFPYFLSCAIGDKSLGLFGPTNPKFFVPEMKNSFYIQGLECINCYNPIDGINGKAYLCKDNVCMKSISVGSVKEKIEKILNRNV